jgi:hypothetical protein
VMAVMCANAAACWPAACCACDHRTASSCRCPKPARAHPHLTCC